MLLRHPANDANRATELSRELAEAKAKLADAQARYARLQGFYGSQGAREAGADSIRLDTIGDSRAALVARARFLEEKLGKMNALVGRGFIQKDRMVDVQIELADVREKTANLGESALRVRVDATKRAGETGLALLDEQRVIDEQQRLIARLGARLGDEQLVRSPHDGRVTEIKVNAGDVIAAGTALATVAPEAGSGSLIALLYVPTADGKRIEPGMVAEIVPTTVERAVYGHIRGRVVSVAPLPATAQGMRRVLQNDQLVEELTAGGAPIEVRIALARDPDARLAFAGLALTLVYVASVSISRFFQIAPLREAAARSGKLAGLTFEILEGLPKLRSACAEPRALARWTAAYRAELGAQARSERIGNHFAAFADGWRILTMIGLFATAALLASGDLPAGVFIAFLIAFASFQASFTAFCEALLAIYTNAPLAERACPILHTQPEAGAGRADPGKLSGAIQASGLSFSYGAGLAPLIDGLSFDIQAGEHLAIVGGSGSGKSTILRLLLGFESPTTGSLTYDGQELTSLDPSRVRAQIGVVLQSSQLFAGSIQDNIRGASHATLEQCAAAAERAGLTADLAEMPMGLHTPITEGAGTLSGGQRQRILIARAIAADPAILFFDEATSALDNLTQAIVARTLDGLGATRITIAHRLSTVRNADRICVLERGKFVETGDFETLMRAGGRFATFARRQLMEA